MASILLIDDDALAREALAAALRHCGHAVTEAADGVAGVRLYHESPADLVLTDIVMPEKEGLDVIRQLRADFPAARIIAMSGGFAHAPGLYLRMATQFGANAVLAKPIELEALRTTVAAVLADAPPTGR
jgi:CheY-like chemotaxis protein